MPPEVNVAAALVPGAVDAVFPHPVVVTGAFTMLPPDVGDGFVSGVVVDVTADVCPHPLKSTMRKIAGVNHL
jgi:hypothetical protein